MSAADTAPFAGKAAEREPDLVDLALPLAARWHRLVAVPLVTAVLAYGGTWLLRPEFTASTTFLPPQQQNTLAGSLTSSLGMLAGLTGAQVKSPAEQFVAFMQSVTATDRIIERFSLMSVYDSETHEEARKALARHTKFTIGKKEGLITTQVDDTDPKRAAAIANGYVEELRRMTDTLAVTEAQQRRMFFERELQQTKTRLVQAQLNLQDTGFNQGALKSEPRSAAAGYAMLRQQLVTAEVKLDTLLSSMADTNPMVVQQRALVQALRSQVETVENNAEAGGHQSADYVSRYREYKYQETLFEQMAKQYELARVDEAREGAVIQVVDLALPPERRSFPKRVPIALGVAVMVTLLYGFVVIARHRWRLRLQDAEFAGRVAELRRQAGAGA